MKKLLLMAALVFTIGAAQAQEAAAPKTPEEKAAQKVNRLSQKYDLSKDQQARLQPELVKSELTIAQKQQAAREARQQVDQAQRAQEAVILEVMEPEQQKRYEADKLLRKEKMELKKKQHKNRMGRGKAE
jgi:hypothetical protein